MRISNRTVFISLLLCSSLCLFACGKLDPPASKYKTALIMAVSASPVIQVFFRTDYKDMESAADGKYDHKAVPVVDGGVAYIWKLRSAPDKTWYQVKHQGGDIFEVSLQIGFSNQQAVFVVNVGNGAVEKKFDSISARYERAFGM